MCSKIKGAILLKTVLSFHFGFNIRNMYLRYARENWMWILTTTINLYSSREFINWVSNCTHILGDFYKKKSFYADAISFYLSLCGFLVRRRLIRLSVFIKKFRYRNCLKCRDFPFVQFGSVTLLFFNKGRESLTQFPHLLSSLVACVIIYLYAISPSNCEFRK